MKGPTIKFRTRKALRHDARTPMAVRVAVIDRAIRPHPHVEGFCTACEVCGDIKERQDLHHEYYIVEERREHYSISDKSEHEFGLEQSEDLLLLCHSCHRSKHGISCYTAQEIKEWK